MTTNFKTPLLTLLYSINLIILISCSSVTIIPIPKTRLVVPPLKNKKTEIIWTSRTLTRSFDYLGKIRIKNTNLENAVSLLKQTAYQLQADAVIDIYMRQVGFWYLVEGFPIKFKDESTY